jgi:hypothetical protein
MTQRYDTHRSAGYFLSRDLVRPDQRSADLLPERLVSASECLASFVPGTWTLTWVHLGEEARQKSALDFGLSPETLPSVMESATASFERDWGWPYVFYTLAGARRFHSSFLSSVPAVRLFGLALPQDLFAAFSEAAEPGTGEGETGFLTCAKAGQALEAGGVVLGWELLGFEHGMFHSWLCNGLERDVSQVLSIRPNTHGLISSLDDARRAADYCGQESVGAEPALWQPWLVVEYSLPQPLAPAG